MMGTSVEFFFQPPGKGPLSADYLLGEDVVRPGGLRSMSDPASFGDPDHYSNDSSVGRQRRRAHQLGHPEPDVLPRYRGRNQPNVRASVQGVGGANREQIEKVIYRAFTQLMPANATFSVARAATIQAARDLTAPTAPPNAPSHRPGPPWG